MTFAIDTGTDVSIVHYIPDWFRDIYPADAPDGQLAHDYGYHLIGALENPKMLKTARTHFIAAFRFMEMLAEMHPGVFDELVCKYAERVLAD